MLKNVFRLFFILFIFGHIGSLSAQKQEIRTVGKHHVILTSWTEEHGLPRFKASSFVEDINGILWILSTEHHLYTFDGKRLEQIVKSPTNTTHSQLCKDAHGHIYVLWDKATKYRVLKFNAGRYLPTEETILSKLLDGASNVRLLALNNTIYAYRTDHNATTIYKCTANRWKGIYSSKSHKNRELLILPQATGKYFLAWDKPKSALTLVDSTGNVTKKIEFAHLLPEKSSSFDHLLWLTSNSGNLVLVYAAVINSEKDQSLYTFFTYDSSKQIIKEISYKKVTGELSSQASPFGFQNSASGYFLTNLTQLGHGNELLSSLMRIKAKDILYFGDFTAIALSGESGFWSFENDMLWHIEARPTYFRSYTMRNAVSKSTRLIIPINDDNFFVSTYSGNYVTNFVDDEEKLTFQNYFCSATRQRNGDILLAEEGSGQLFILNTSLKLTKAPNYIQRVIGKPVVFADPIGALWLGGETGLYELDATNYALKHTFLRDTNVFCFLYSHSKLWIGTEHGMFDLQARKAFLTNFNVYAAYAENNDIMWLGTNKGLVKWQVGTQHYKQFTTAEGLSSNSLHAVYPDKKENLWLSSENGLMRFNKNNNSVYTFFKEDGTTNTEFNRFAHLVAKNGTLILGGIDGITLIDLSKKLNVGKARNFPLKLKVVKTFNANNGLLEELGSGTRQTLSSQTERVELDLLHAHYSLVPITYEYRFTSFKDDWRTFDGKSLTFLTPEFGSYSLEIRASVLGRKALTSILNIEIVKPRPFYKSFAFLFMVVALLLALGYLAALYTNSKVRIRLNNIITSKTEELHEKNLTIERQMLELRNKDKLKTTFLKNLSHDIRTPLSLILLSLDQAQKNIKSPTLLEKYFISMRHNAAQLELFTSQILSFDALKYNGEATAPKPVGYPGFLKSICEGFISKAATKSIHYSYSFEPPIPSMLLIQGEITIRIVMNLLDNAFKFTPNEGTVKVKFELLDEHLFVRIEDSGPGIDPSEHDRIFERYYQGKAADSEEITGLGIGLAYIKEALEGLGGTIFVGSSALGGASFLVSIPITSISAANAADHFMIEGDFTSKNTLETRDFIYTVNPDKPTILVVEDNTEMMEAIRQLLATDYNLVLAKNGRIAIDVLKNNASIDLIISDIMMDDVNGIDLLKQIKSGKGKLAALPVILLTAAIDENMKLEAFRIGADSFLFKPFIGELLKTQIKNLLKRQQAILAYKNEYASKNTEEWDEHTKDETLQNKWLKSLEKVVEAHYSDPSLDVTTIAEKMHISLSTLNRRLKLITGLNASVYITKYRLSKALMLLNDFDNLSISEVCFKVGFKNLSHFTKSFKQEYGMLPSKLLNRF